ncbi:MAG: cytochrome c [Myxococcales bacterium]|nr:cytochrome c [Myxococcales bacterium]
MNHTHHPRIVIWLSALALAFAGVLFAGGAAHAQPKDKKLDRLWKAKCSSCHGMDGKGDTEKGKKMAIEDMTSPEFQKKYTDEQMKKAILEGVKEVRDGVKKEMDPLKDELKPDQVDALVGYVRSLGAQK